MSPVSVRGWGRWVALALFATLGLVLGWHGWTWPHGSRPDFLPTLLAALRTQALDQGGWYPDDLLSLPTVTQLQRMGIGPQLAGLSGDVAETRRRLAAGEPLDGQVSSWVYWPGFRADEAAGLAILWDRNGGTDAQGRRASGRVDGSHRLIPDTQWAVFVRQQSDLRSQVIRQRRRPMGAATMGPLPVP